jgi:hypothetical protein
MSLCLVQRAALYRSLAATTLLLTSGSAGAEVVSSSPHGFQIRQVVNLVAKPVTAYNAFGDVSAWWDPKHTYSGKPSNLTLNLSPGGCFCEQVPPGGGVEHMRVSYLEPDKRIVLTGSLGPLLYEATSAVMDVQFKSTASGSQLVLDYRAAGFFRGGADKLAQSVDQVLTEQVKRYRVYATQRPRH